MVKLKADNGGNSSAASTGSNTRAQCFPTCQSKVDSPIVSIDDLNDSGTCITAPNLVQSTASTAPEILQQRGIYYADLEVKDEVCMAEIENEMLMNWKEDELSSEDSYENVEVTKKVGLEQTDTGMVMNLKEKESLFEGNFELMNSTSFAAQETETKFNSLKFKEELHSITTPEIALQLSNNSSSTLGGTSNPDMDDVDVDDAVWNKSIGLQGKILDIGRNLVGYPRADSLAVAEVKGTDLLSRVPAPHLEFGGWKKYLNFRDELLKDTQGSLRDMNALNTIAIHTAPKVLHKWIEEPRHRTTRLLQVAREHIYKTEWCLLYSLRTFGNDIESLRIAFGTIFSEVVGWEFICQNGDIYSRSHVEDHLQLNVDECFSYHRPIYRDDLLTIYRLHIDDVEDSLIKPADDGFIKGLIKQADDGFIKGLIKQADDGLIRGWNVDKLKKESFAHSIPSSSGHGRTIDIRTVE
ncbi:hypothetical protein SASPL_148734 [Salvia splendens]|uniref:Uncharacterized protein n=1 Tax=Salvia splendens TaxID=180675 RepID=A0A8X8Z4D3_SALSN|nr:hypothetical protein SASPL_148734 [Salvia splendens]